MIQMSKTIIQINNKLTMLIVIIQNNIMRRILNYYYNYYGSETSAIPAITKSSIEQKL